LPPELNKPLPPIPEPKGTLDEPDRYTKKAPDYTEPNAPERVFFINLGFFRYGTKDKAHGAAVLLSILLFMLLVGVIVSGYYQPEGSEWAAQVFTWLGGAFLFVVGVAVGRGTTDKDKTDTEGE
jgi:peptidoglycan/LPS O-acetylase OafA/YrhL